MSDKLQQIRESDAFGRFVEHCRADTSLERCGLFVLREGLIEFEACENHAFDKKNSFLIHPVDYVRCADSGDVIMVGHSHVTAPADPSNEDRVHSENCKIPFVILQVETGDVGYYEPTGEVQPLIGRSWRLGVSDCYSLVRDYYKTQGLEIRDYVRNDADCLFKESMFLKYYEENGFVDVTGQEPRVNDGVFIQLLANIPNHVAVFVETGIILHHLQGRLSCRDPYGGYWRRHTVKLLRHPKWS